MSFLSQSVSPFVSIILTRIQYAKIYARQTMDDVHVFQIPQAIFQIRSFPALVIVRVRFGYKNDVKVKASGNRFGLVHG